MSGLNIEVSKTPGMKIGGANSCDIKVGGSFDAYTMEQADARFATKKELAEKQEDVQVYSFTDATKTGWVKFAEISPSKVAGETISATLHIKSNKIIKNQQVDAVVCIYAYEIGGGAASIRFEQMSGTDATRRLKYNVDEISGKIAFYINKHSEIIEWYITADMIMGAEYITFYSEDYTAMVAEVVEGTDATYTIYPYARGDEKGNRIPSTYATKEELSQKQDALTEEQLSNINAVPNKADKIEVANALRLQAGGHTIELPDISPLEHTLDVRIVGATNPETVEVILVDEFGNELPDEDGNYTLRYKADKDGNVRGITSKPPVRAGDLRLAIRNDDNAIMVCEYNSDIVAAVGFLRSYTDDEIYKTKKTIEGTIEETTEETYNIMKSETSAAIKGTARGSGHILIEDISAQEPALHIRLLPSEPVSFEDVVVTLHDTANEESFEFTPSREGLVSVPSRYPITYITATYKDNPNLSIAMECEYPKDISKIIDDMHNEIDEMGTKLENDWELISSGELTEEVSSLVLDGFSCSKIELKIYVASSENNPQESAMRVRTNKNSNTGGGSDDGLVRMFRTSGTNTPASILLEMHNKTIKGQLVNSGVNKTYANYYYSDPSASEYDSITGLYLQPVTSGCVFGVGTTYELWGVKK